MAVYTDVSDEELEAFISSYDIGTLTSFKGIAEGVENSNYLVHTDQRPYILTLYEKRVRPEDLPYFLGLMEHLAARGISCPLPVRDREGRALRELAGRPAALISFLEGLSVRRPGIEHCAGLGQALARLFPGFDADVGDRVLGPGAPIPTDDDPSDVDPSDTPVLSDDATELLAQADELFMEADDALADGDLGEYQAKVEGARVLVSEAFDLISAGS